MSKIIELPKEIEKLPTSQLIFYMTNPELSDESLKSKIEVALFGRLTKGYKLYPDTVRRFVEREKEIINMRGYNLDSYVFGKDVTYEELFKIFYDSVTLISKIVNIEDNFNILTMSEIAEFYMWFTIYKKRFTKRGKILVQELTKNDILQKKLLNKNNIFFEVKEQEINRLRELYKLLDLQEKNERSLIGYNNMLANCMLKKLKTIMNYGIKDEVRSLLTILKEGFLLMQKSPTQNQERKLYKDINFDAYTHYTDSLSEYNITGYSFARRK